MTLGWRVFREADMRVQVLLLLGFLGALPPSVLAQERADTSRVAIEARVLDFGNWMPLPGVRVRLPDLGIDTLTDADGRFRVENLRRGIYSLVLDKDGYLTADGSLTVFRAGSFDVHMRRVVAAEPGILRGRVLDGATNAPVATAAVSLEGTGLTRITDAQGRFGFSELPPGQYQMSVSLIGYASRTDGIWVRSKEATDVEVPLALDPVALDPIVVTVHSNWLARNGFYRRADRGYSGRQWTRTEIEERDPINLSDMLRMVPGIRVEWRGLGGVQVLSNRGARGFSASGCPLALYVDGMLMSDFDVDMISPRAVEGLEVYNGSNAPIQYQFRHLCGVVLVWIRH